MFCVECGKEGPIFRDGVCHSCYMKTHKFTESPDFIDLPVCSHCNSYKYKNSWTSELFGEVIKRLIKNNFKISKELEKIDINTECKEEKEGMHCKVYITGLIDDEEITEEHEVIVRYRRTVCDVCSKQFGGYHEAILQIRGDKKKLSKQEINDIASIVENLVEDLRAKGNRGLFITDADEEHGGLNYYLSEKGFGLIVAKKIQELYGGEIKQSSKNIGMKDSRQVYRMTYLIRLPSYKKYDFVRIEDKYFMINSIHGNNVRLVDLSNSEETAVETKNMQTARIIGGKELVKEMIIVSQTKDEIQVMDPKTYKIQVVKKPKPINFQSEKIRVLVTEKQMFIIPS